MRKKISWIKRGLAVMLSVCMVFGVAPIQAGAEENDSEIAVQTNDSAGKTEQQSTEEEECKHEGVEITFNSNGFGNCPKCNATVYQPAVETTDKYDIDDDSMKENVYEISNAGQLYWFAGLVNGTLDGVKQNTLANAILTANITANENLLDSLQYDTEGNVSNGSDFISWTPIADCMGDPITVYSGTFDGNNKTVSGLYFNGNSSYIGLFGSSEIDGNIKNVGVVDSYFKGNEYVGGVCGSNYGTITNCYNAGNLTAIQSGANIGGICGDTDGTITNCYNTGTVTATGTTSYVGGVCARTGSDGIISNCYNTGTVTATGTTSYVGGVCARTGSDGIISNCYNTGTVTATDPNTDIGGICALHYGWDQNCYYLADTEDENGGKTIAQFASGEVAYLLSQGGTIDEVTYDGSIWGQALGENGDTYPVLDSTKRVYQVDKYDGCEGKPGSSTKVYSNQSTSIYEEHSIAYEPVENGNAIKAACNKCNATYTVKLTRPAATSDEKIVYDGTEKKAGTAIDSGNTGIETIPENAITYATVTNGTPSTYSTTAPKNAGTYKAKLTLGKGDNIVSIEINFTIEKAASPTIAGEEKSYIYSTGSDGKTIGVDIAGKLPTDRGITTYAVAKTDTEQLLSEVTVDTAGNLTYKVNQVDSTKVGKTAIIAVTASMENYENAGYTLTISSIDKKAVEIKSGNSVSVDGSNVLIYGEKISKLTLGNTVFVEAGTDDVIEGILSWSNPDEIPAAGTTQAGWVFKPADGTHCAELTGKAAITVAKATPVIAEKSTATALTYGQKLSDSTLTGGKATYKTVDGTEVAGTFAWKNSNIKPTVADSGKTEYDVTFTPSDTDNYNAVDMKISLTVNKAAKAPNMPEAAMAPAHSTKKVGDITLPDGWNWSDTDKDKELTDGVAVTATAVYTGADKGNYENVSVTITITRSSCDHKNTEVRDKKEVTCTEDGYSGDVYCKDCTVLVTKGSVITHPGHLLREVAAKDATATVAGNIAYYVCENAGCGKYFADNAAKTEITDKSSIIIPATGDGSSSGGGSSSSGGASSGGSSSDGTSGGGTSSGTTDKPSVPKKGTKIKGNDGSTYIVTSGKGKTPTVQYTAPKSTAKGTVTIPAKAKVDGVSYRVTSIADNAFKNNKKITKVVIGNNIVSIGKNAFAKCTKLVSVIIGKNVIKIGKDAFAGCKKLKKIVIKTKKLTKKSVAKGAFRSVGKKVVVQVPKSEYKAYKKLLRAKGLSKKVKIKRY